MPRARRPAPFRRAATKVGCQSQRRAMGRFDDLWQPQPRDGSPRGKAPYRPGRADVAAFRDGLPRRASGRPVGTMTRLSWSMRRSPTCGSSLTGCRRRSRPGRSVGPWRPRTRNPVNVAGGATCPAGSWRAASAASGPPLSARSARPLAKEGRDCLQEPLHHHARRPWGSGAASPHKAPDGSRGRSRLLARRTRPRSMGCAPAAGPRAPRRRQSLQMSATATVCLLMPSLPACRASRSGTARSGSTRSASGSRPSSPPSLRSVPCAWHPSMAETYRTRVRHPVSALAAKGDEPGALDAREAVRALAPCPMPKGLNAVRNASSAASGSPEAQASRATGPV